MKSGPPWSIILLIPLLVWTCASRPTGANHDWEAQRMAMVKDQLQARDIRSREVLEVMAKVPRHLFVPPEARSDAYADHAVPIGYSQTISQPYIVALMTQAAEPAPHHRTLEVGTGSGYQAAVLGELVQEVYTIEIIPELAREAESTLKELGYDQVFVRHGDGYRGWPEKAPFDIILITAAAERVPDPLVEQLAEGGRLVMPLGQIDGVQQLIRLTKTQGKIESETLTSVRFVPMTGEIQDSPR